MHERRRGEARGGESAHLRGWRAASCADARSRCEVVCRGLRCPALFRRTPAASSMASVGKCRNCSKTVYQLEAVTAIDKVRTLAINHSSRLCVVSRLAL